MKDKIVARCVACSAEFTQVEIEGHSVCPGCGSKSMPLDPGHDVKIKINVHELRILGIWAEHHARDLDTKHKDDPEHQSMYAVLDQIARRIEEQLEPATWQPITLTRELIDLKENYPSSKITIIKDGQETEL